MPTLDDDGTNPFVTSVPMPFDWKTNDPLMDEIVEELMSEFEGVNGHKRLIRKSLRAILIACVRVGRHNPRAYIGYVRNNNFTSISTRKNPFRITSRSLSRVIDVLVDKGFLRHFMGRRDGESSRFKPLSKMLGLIDEYGLNEIRFERELIRGGIVLKDEQKRYVYDYEDTEQTNRSRAILKAYNQLIVQTDIQLGINTSGRSYQYDRVLSYRSFNNSSFSQGGRYYGNWWSGCKREDRVHITINGQRTIELDYKANHLCFIYALCGVSMSDFPNDDPYMVSDFPRALIKEVFMKSLNAANVYEAYGAMRKAIRFIKDRETKDEWKKHIYSQDSFDFLVSSLVEFHPVLDGYLCSGMGVHLQFQDSQVAEFVLDKMTESGVPVLCIHDSFIVQRDKEQELRVLMEEAYRFVGYPDHIPSIELK